MAGQPEMAKAHLVADRRQLPVLVPPASGPLSARGDKRRLDQRAHPAGPFALTIALEAPASQFRALQTASANLRAYRRGPAAADSHPAAADNHPAAADNRPAAARDRRAAPSLA